MLALHSRLAAAAILCTGVLAATACGKDRSKPPAEPVGTTQTTTSDMRGQGQDSPGEAVTVVITEEVRRACDLPNEPHEAPRFDFDSAQLRPRGEDILTRVAACVSANRLGDVPLKVVGHADPRGSDGYNEQLGHYRAVAAKQHLVQLGVPSERLQVESRGERDATGKDERSWALDRRIEIRLGSPPQ